MKEDDFQMQVILLLGFEMISVWDGFLLMKDERRETLLSHIKAQGAVEKAYTGHES